MDKFKIKILVIQETQLLDENHFDSVYYKIYIGRTIKLVGTVFTIHKSIPFCCDRFHIKIRQKTTLSVQTE